MMFWLILVGIALAASQNVVIAATLSVVGTLLALVWLYAANEARKEPAPPSWDELTVQFEDLKAIRQEREQEREG